MKPKQSTRRNFLKTAAYASAGTLVLPTILSSCAKGANDRIQVAHIGVGRRGPRTTRDYFLPLHDARSLATCDAFSTRREELAAEISAYYLENNQERIECKTYLDYQEILDRKDIDAVHISTPDHWHLVMAIKAAQAGKHIYLEKPLGLSLQRMIELERIMKKNKLVFHYGTQQRSLDHVAKGVEMVKSGKIGDIEKIDVWAPCSPNAEPQGSTESQPPPPELDFDRWLGPAQVKPYSEARIHRTSVYHMYDYGLGLIAGWGAHALDIATWALKEKMMDTATFTGSGSLFPEGHFFNSVHFWDINIEYENGLKIHFVSDNYAEEMKKNLNSGDGTTFYGTKGWISLGRGAAASNIPELHNELNATTVYGENNRHGYHFIQAVKGEMEELCPLNEAILTDCISQMGNILVRSGKDKIVWDPVARKIVNYPELEQEHFDRKMREPYTL